VPLNLQLREFKVEVTERHVLSVYKESGFYHFSLLEMDGKTEGWLWGDTQKIPFWKSEGKRRKMFKNMQNHTNITESKFQEITAILAEADRIGDIPEIKQRTTNIEDEEEGITDKYIADRIMNKYLFFCDRHDENATLYIWNGAGWDNGVAENYILNELSEIFKDEQDRGGMVLERTVNFIKGQAMNLNLTPKPSNIIAFQNGLYDISTGELKPHDPTIFYTNVIPHNFDPEAKCPKWEKWLKEVVREEDIDFIQEWIGYLMYDSYPEPAFVILVGKGQNGKSVFMHVIQELVGEKNYTNVSLHDIVSGPYALSELHRKLANICDEISNRAVRNSGPLKMISAGSWVEARQIYGKHFHFRNYAKPMYSCNEPPEFKDESDAIKYRLKAIEFPYTFRKNPDATKGEKQARDRRELEAELKAEIPGIINWALKGLKRLMDNNFTFTESRSTEETWAFYRRKSNPVACFVEECLEFTDDPADVISKPEMYEKFTAWLKSVKIDLNVNRDRFFKAMKALGVEATRSREHDMKRVYLGWKCSNVPTVQPPKFPENNVQHKGGSEVHRNTGSNIKQNVGTLEHFLNEPILTLFNDVLRELIGEFQGYAFPMNVVVRRCLARGIDRPFTLIEEEKKRGRLMEHPDGKIEVIRHA